jgi:hypothetical protein
MAQTGIIDLKKLSKDLAGVVSKLNEVETIATVRTINEVTNASKTIIAQDVSMDTGIAIGTTKRRIEVQKASKGDLNAALSMKDSRVTYPSPRQLKKGASFLTLGRKRIKVTSRISTKQGLGSRPFVMKGQHSGKKIPVYVTPGTVQNSKSSERKVQAMYFSSIPHVARKDWQNKVQTYARLEFRRRYPKQLKKANKGY